MSLCKEFEIGFAQKAKLKIAITDNYQIIHYNQMQIHTTVQQQKLF